MPLFSLGATFTKFFPQQFKFKGSFALFLSKFLLHVCYNILHMTRQQILGMCKVLESIPQMTTISCIIIATILHTTFQNFHRHIEILWFSGISVRTTNDGKNAYYILYSFLNCIHIICACLVLISECHMSAIHWCERRACCFPTHQ